MRTRSAALLMALVLVLVLCVAFSSPGVPGAHRVAAPAAAGAGGSITVRPDAPGPSIAATEPGRAPVLARAESQRNPRALAAAFVAIVLLAMAALSRRGAQLRGSLELSIRSLTEWWRPAPGGRAPPRPIAS